MLAEDLWDIVKGTHEPLEEEEEEERKAWEKKDVKALYPIQSSCGDEMYKFIKDKTTAKEAWDTLFNFEAKVESTITRNMYRHQKLKKKKTDKHTALVVPCSLVIYFKL